MGYHQPVIPHNYLLLVVIRTLLALALTRAVCIKIMQVKIIVGFSAAPMAAIPPVKRTSKASHNRSSQYKQCNRTIYFVRKLLKCSAHQYYTLQCLCGQENLTYTYDTVHTELVVAFWATFTQIQTNEWNIRNNEFQN